jgi:hypothetical protein
VTDTKLADVPDHVTKSDRPDMAHIKLRKAVPGRLEGDVMFVDINSARALVGRGDAEFVKADDVAATTGAFQVARGRANVQTMVVTSADVPATGAPTDAAPEVIETGTGAGTIVEAPTSGSNKADIVAYAEGKLTGPDGAPLSAAELEAKSKADLVRELKLS